MNAIKSNTGWLEKLIPEGFPTKTTTIITGPGGSGKPLIGETIVSAWLENGGSVIFMALQYPDSEFVLKNIKHVAGLDIQKYKEKIVFIQLDTEIDSYKVAHKHLIYANLLKPDVWEHTLDIASKNLPNDGPGVLVFSSALNLLLFSPTFGDAILDKIKETITTNTDKTYLISVSTSAKRKEIKELEELADNLILSTSEKKPFRLYMRILRMKDVAFIPDKIQVPISPETLTHMKGIADHSKGKVMPAIQKI